MSGLSSLADLTFSKRRPAQAAAMSSGRFSGSTAQAPAESHAMVSSTGARTTQGRPALIHGLRSTRARSLSFDRLSTQGPSGTGGCPPEGGAGQAPGSRKETPPALSPGFTACPVVPEAC
ncbi:MAG TPA: hypothetical protein PLF04_01720 [Candidatus Fermentibacter daniensis]|nr:MAG: hypothetical protein AO395_05175 [Candidatus Fermentibacter daniensis]KZD19711.1 MAG: hypothetical protein AO396_08470 [Candidatus Fermentibacter daniensis]HOA04645.1 hypothetical protein [Candidatus Fermentibacter daniensis]HOD18902.1 hypothetical protein [Candidatus Fermentibacter daniensis]HOG54163.1 hypothetical protein [Candidatus Fermentibacter daniensis]